MKTTIEQIVSILTEEQQQLLKDTIRHGFWGDATDFFLDEDGKKVEDWADVYITNDAKRGGHFTGRKISSMFRSIYKKLCPINGTGEVISHCSDWWGDGSGDVLFIREKYIKAFEQWART